MVPASWSKGGYTALFVEEAPEVRFDDVMTVHTGAADALFMVDPKFLEVCEPGSLEVCGTASDLPVMVGAKVEGENVRVRVKGNDEGAEVRVVIRLTGIRRGFAGLRFPDRTAEEFEANERFLKMARA